MSFVLGPAGPDLEQTWDLTWDLIWDLDPSLTTVLLNAGTGLESLSGREGGCLIVYHHGAIPVDYMYTVAGIYIATGKIVHSIVHRNRVNLEIYP